MNKPVPLALLLLVLPVSAALSDGAGVPSSATETLVLERLEEARAAIEISDVTRARSIVRELLRDYPRDPRPYLTASYLEFVDGRTDSAIRMSTHSLHIRESTSALMNLSRLYLAKFRTDEAINAARRATVMDPGSAVAWLRLAESHLKDTLTGGVPPAAEHALRRARELDPSLTEAALLEAKLLLAGGDSAGAHGAVEKILARNPDLGPALLIMGRILSATGDEDAAIPYLQRAAELSSPPPGAHRALGEALLHQGADAEALAALRRAVASDPEDRLAILHLASVLKRRGERDEVAGLQKRYLELQRKAQREDRWRDGSADVSPMGAWRLIQQEEIARALDVARQCVEESPLNPMARLALASGLVRRGSFEASLEHIRVGTYFGPCDSVSLSNFGTAVYQAGQVPHARRAWMKALYADPSLRASILPFLRTELELAVAACVRIPTAERTAARTGVHDAALVWLGGDPEGALERFEALSREHPDDRFIQIYVPIARMGLEQWPEAVAAFERAGSRRPLEQVPGFLHAVALANTGREADALDIWRRIGMDYSFPPFP